jgi:hypothetical protein
LRIKRMAATELLALIACVAPTQLARNRRTVF